MSSEMNVIPEGPGSVSPRMKHRWTRVRGRAGPSSTQWPGFSGVPWTDGSGFDSLGPMYATSRPRTSRYHSIAFRGSETTIAIVSTPRTVMRIEMESEIRAMTLSVSGRRVSALRRPAAVHLRVPLYDLVVRDPVDLLFHRELVLRFPGLHDPPGGGFALELRDEELPFSAPGFEGRDHLGAVEDDVAGPHVVLEARVRGERLGGGHAEAADDPPQDFAAGVVPANLQVCDRTIPVVRIPGHVEPSYSFRRAAVVVGRLRSDRIRSRWREIGPSSWMIRRTAFMSFVRRIAFAALYRPRSASVQYVQYSGIASPFARSPLRWSRSSGRNSFTRRRAAKSERRPPRAFAAATGSANRESRATPCLVSAKASKSFGSKSRGTMGPWAKKSENRMKPARVQWERSSASGTFFA